MINIYNDLQTIIKEFICDNSWAAYDFKYNSLFFDSKDLIYIAFEKNNFDTFQYLLLENRYSERFYKNILDASIYHTNPKFIRFLLKNRFVDPLIDDGLLIKRAYLLKTTCRQYKELKKNKECNKIISKLELRIFRKILKRIRILFGFN